ncbi:MAG TPA: cyanate hydratase, partial [Cupriavidus sp.]|nr:cyanate hydratase [Cupriavidus sp.]
MNRSDVTDLIIEAKVLRGIRWADVAERVGKSKEWTTAACLGQMAFDEAGARAVMDIFGLPAEAEPWL